MSSWDVCGSYNVQGRSCPTKSRVRKKRPSLLGRPLPRARRHPTSVGQIYRPVPWRTVQVGVRGPRSLYETVTGEGHVQVQRLVAPLVERWSILQPRIRLAACGAPVDPDACSALLLGQEIVLEDRNNYGLRSRTGFDGRLGILEELAISEKEYNADLAGTYNLYEKPLKQLMSVQPDETRALFEWVEPICSVSNLLLIELHAAMKSWDSQQTRIAAPTGVRGSRSTRRGNKNIS